jgi:glycosyltransferase involved in cell wall biosynthesis
MRLLFAHDHRFQLGPNGEVYTLGSFPVPAWDRYLDQFDEVHVVARDGGNLAEDHSLARSDRPNVRFELLPNLSSLRQLIRPSPKLVAQMASAVREADAVVARLPSEIGLLAIKQAKLQHKPYAIEVVGCPWDGYFHKGGLTARAYAPLAFLRMRSAVRAGPLALYVTSSWLQHRYPTQGWSVSASNVALQPRATDGGREARLAALSAGANPVLGTVASLRTRAKGLHIALAALARLRSSGLELEYRILGPGDPEPWKRLAAKLKVADLVHFDGVRDPGEGVFAWLDQIDVHLQPSFREGLPRATIEAMSRGVACVGSTCGGIPELLPPERLHRPGDVAGLAERIRWLVSDADWIAAASKTDLETAQQFNPASLQARRREIFSRLRKAAEKRRFADSSTV